VLLSDDFKLAVEREFSFLQSDYSFPPFDFHWHPDETWLDTRLNDIGISVVYYSGVALPQVAVWNYAEEQTFDNTMTPTYRHRIEGLEKANPILSSLSKDDEDSAIPYLMECASILKRHPEVLAGDTTAFDHRKPFKKLNVGIYSTDKTGSTSRASSTSVTDMEELYDVLHGYSPFARFLRKVMRRLFGFPKNTKRS